MQAILVFFYSIVAAITQIVNAIITFFSDIVYIINICLEFALNVPSYFGWMPTSSFIILETIFGIVIVYKVLGREG